MEIMRKSESKNFSTTVQTLFGNVCIGMQTCKQWQQFTQVSCISCNTHTYIFTTEAFFNLNPVLNPSGLESEFFSV